MNDDDLDITESIKAKSDQINAADLMGTTYIGTIEKVTRGTTEQPWNIHFQGLKQVFRPSKACLRILSFIWGTKAKEWTGRKLELFNNPDVLYKGEKVGGVRILNASHIDKPMTIAVQEKRGKKTEYTVSPIAADAKPSKPFYTDEQVAAKMPDVYTTVTEGKLTVAEAIERLERTALLTDEQKKKIKEQCKK